MDNEIFRMNISGIELEAIAIDRHADNCLKVIPAATTIVRLCRSAEPMLSVRDAREIVMHLDLIRLAAGRIRDFPDNPADNRERALTISKLSARIHQLVDETQDRERERQK